MLTWVEAGGGQRKAIILEHRTDFSRMRAWQLLHHRATKAFRSSQFLKHAKPLPTSLLLHPLILWLEIYSLGPWQSSPLKSNHRGRLLQPHCWSPSPQASCPQPLPTSNSFLSLTFIIIFFLKTFCYWALYDPFAHYLFSPRQCRAMRCLCLSLFLRYPKHRPRACKAHSICQFHLKVCITS